MAATHIPCDFPYFPIPYGCWCGITLPWPSPYKPIDDLDEACKSHDWCYEAAADEGCSIWDEYVFNYKWHDDNGEVSKPSKKFLIIKRKMPKLIILVNKIILV